MLFSPRFIFSVFFALSLCAPIPIRALPAVENFFGRSEFGYPKLSPSGRQMAVRGSDHGVEYLAVVDLATMTAQPAGVVREGYMENFWWKGEDLLLMLVSNKDADANFRILDLKNRTAKEAGQISRDQATLVHSLPHDPDCVLVHHRAALKKFNLRTGRLDPITKRAPYGSDWLVDAEGNVVGMTGQDHLSSFLYWQEGPNQTWKSQVLGSVKAPRFDVWATHPDGKRVIAREYLTDRPDRIVALDPKTLATTEIFSSSEVDPNGISRWGDNRPVTRAIEYETDLPRTHFLDEQSRLIQLQVDRLLPGMVNTIFSTSLDENTLLVSRWDDHHFSSLFLVDRKQEKVTSLGPLDAELAQVDVGSSKYFRFTARDGLNLTGRYFPPRGTSPAPLVVLVGPYISRSQAGYEDRGMPLLLASRGYAVACINYRGTSGFGYPFAKAGDKQLVTGMANDIEDGVKWLIAEGWADPKRIGLLGMYDAGIIGVQVLAQSSLFSVWLNVNTPMIADTLTPSQT